MNKYISQSQCLLHFGCRHNTIKFKFVIFANFFLNGLLKFLLSRCHCLQRMYFLDYEVNVSKLWKKKKVLWIQTPNFWRFSLIKSEQVFHQTLIPFSLSRCGSRTQTLDVRMMRLVFYHCATADRSNIKYNVICFPQYFRSCVIKLFTSIIYFTVPYCTLQYFMCIIITSLKHSSLFKVGCRITLL